MKPEDADAAKGRFLVLGRTGKKLLQTGCWFMASGHVARVKGASCWRLPRVKGGKPVKVLP